VTDIYKISLNDVFSGQRKGAFLLLKYPTAKKLKIKESCNYIIDKCKLVLNKNKEMVFVSTAMTVLIEY